VAGKALAQQRTDRIRAFREELEALEREGALVLGADQRARLEEHHRALLEDLSRRYDVDVSDAQRQMSLGMRITSFLGAVALAAAVYFFFYRFWGLLGTASQVTLLVAAPLAALAGTEVAARRERTLYVASLMATLAVACWVLNLNVLGAIFNITPSQHALLAWGTFAAMLAYGYGLRLQLAAALVCGIGWVAASLGVFTGITWGSFWQRPESVLLAGLACFAAPLFAATRRHDDFAPVYRIVGAASAFVAILTLAFFSGGSWLPLSRDTLEGIYQVIGFVLAAGAVWLGVRQGWIDLVRLGAAAFVVFLFAKFFDWWWDWMPKYVFFLILGAMALLILWLLRRLRVVSMGRPA
jgi:uncharacterized membrane protein